MEKQAMVVTTGQAFKEAVVRLCKEKKCSGMKAAFGKAFLPLYKQYGPKGNIPDSELGMALIKTLGIESFPERAAKPIKYGDKEFPRNASSETTSCAMLNKYYKGMDADPYWCEILVRAKEEPNPQDELTADDIASNIVCHMELLFTE